MKIDKTTTLIDIGDFVSGKAGRRVEGDIRQAIATVRWPRGSRRFTICPEIGKKRDMGNGVVPIKLSFTETLRKRGWTLERRHAAAEAEEEPSVRPGAFDAWLELTEFGLPLFVVEWETGNISSSHRALNKMTLGILQRRLSGGVLVVPNKSLARFLTDRIGTYEELRAYFPLWTFYRPETGYLAIIGVEHDAESKRVPKIPKMTAGRALA